MIALKQIILIPRVVVNIKSFSSLPGTKYFTASHTSSKKIKSPINRKLSWNTCSARQLLSGDNGCLIEHFVRSGLRLRGSDYSSIFTHRTLLPKYFISPLIFKIESDLSRFAINAFLLSESNSEEDHMNEYPFNP